MSHPSRARAILFAAAIAAAASVAGRPARATECAVPAGAAASLARVDAAVRLRFIQRGLRHAAHEARIWAWSSAGVLMFAAAFQVLGATHVPDAGDRADLWLGAASVGFSLAQLALFYPRVTIDQWTLDRHVARAAFDADRCALLAEAETLLARDARSEAIATGPAMHAATFLFNIGVGLALGLGFDRWQSGAINLFVGLALGELQIVTQPTESVALYQRYRSGDLDAPPRAATRRWLLAPLVLRDGAGVAFGASF